MSKYEALQRFLREGTGEAVTLTFGQLRVLVPDIAPSHALDDRWWLNDDISHSHCRSWGDAGYTAHPDRARELVTFRRKQASVASRLRIGRLH